MSSSSTKSSSSPTSTSSTTMFFPCKNGKKCVFKKRGICKFDHNCDNVKPVVKPRMNGYLLANPIVNKISFADIVNGKTNNDVDTKMTHLDDEVQQIQIDLDQFKPFLSDDISIKLDDCILEISSDIIEQINSDDDMVSNVAISSEAITPDLSTLPIYDWPNTPDEMLYPQYDATSILYKVSHVLEQID